jgi:hypothetical protein
VVTELGYRRVYAIRKPLADKNCLEVTFPYELVEREARRLDQSIIDFIRTHGVIVEFNSSNSVTYTITERERKTATKGG